MNVRLLGSVPVALDPDHVPRLVKRLTRLGGSPDCIGTGRAVACSHSIHPEGASRVGGERMHTFQPAPCQRFIYLVCG